MATTSKKSSKATNISRPIWSDPVLQALAYWIGYKKELYRHHLLNEGAMVAEIASLINGNLTNGERVELEKYYGEMDYKNESKNRADLAILKDDKPVCLIEVKRNEASKLLLMSDLSKLADFKRKFNGVRCFLILVSQNEMPKMFVSPKGVSDKLAYEFGDKDFRAKAIRVCKSYSSFKEESLKKSNYVCLIEVVKSK